MAHSTCPSRWFALLPALLVSAPAFAAEAPVEFNRDIRPILSDACYHCHGPDKAKRKAGLRLDSETSAAKVIKAGKATESELYRRVSSTDADVQMPPPKSGRKLDTRQIELLRRWIEQGAQWQKHWAFIPPKTPALPKVKDAGWPRNGIDYFILDRLEGEGLRPSPPTDKTTLIRRVTLDLTGLPPTPPEVDAFLADTSPSAYEKVVDRLLRSPRYGEQMAERWLNAARYADTSGYQTDGERFMWRWRDWVIDSFNRNQPFDQFTIEQIAGDLLANATLEQKIATGFNRNHRGNSEGGIIPEEYAVEYVVDRVETTSTVWLGLTMGCVRCHEHKYDPIKQKEFYQLFAYFNNVPEYGRAIKYGNSPPYIKAPTPAMQKELARLDAQLAAAQKDFADLAPRLAEAQAAWEKTLDRSRPIDWWPDEGLHAHFALDGDTANASDKTKPARFVDGEAAYSAGKLGQAADLEGRRAIEVADVGDFGYLDRFSLAAWVNAKAPNGTLLSRMKDTSRATGYSVRLKNGKLQVNLVVRWLDDATRVETERSLPLDKWQHVTVTYDGSRQASGIKVYVDGRPEKLVVLLDVLNQTFKTTEPFRVGAGGGPEGRFRGLIDDVRIYAEALPAEEAALLASADPITAIVALAPDKRSPEQERKLSTYFLRHHAPDAIRQAHHKVAELRHDRAKLNDSFPTTMVMEEMPTPRDTFVLVRGQYDKHGEKVQPGVPEALVPLPSGVPNNRLGLAKWLVDPGNPLTARVTVNRFWQQHFGTGLVKTVDDFGSQGEWPSHPELLDWLATEFIRSGWDVKALQKRIVMSATYRQSSKVTKELVHKDPENRLLARGPRYRLTAETIRDQALFASGLLVEKLGGPSVKTYQPPGLWKELSDTDYHADSGEGLWRRSLYTFWKRTIAPPAMMTFDASPRETCTVRETRTNTPLQALNLMNDVTYVEASRKLAERVMTEAGAPPEERLTLAFRLATARKPSDAELRILRAGFEHHRAEYRKNPLSALKLVSVGEAKRNEKLDVEELAAYAAVAGLILNLDETITKE
jgi:hypothetical protein